MLLAVFVVKPVAKHKKCSGARISPRPEAQKNKGQSTIFGFLIFYIFDFEFLIFEFEILDFLTFDLGF